MPRGNYFSLSVLPTVIIARFESFVTVIAMLVGIGLGGGWERSIQLGSIEASFSPALITPRYLYKYETASMSIDKSCEAAVVGSEKR